ncbi:MAG: GMC family oxidoreductase N-terminal domain-containing protein [Gammaproteobacteria bacterium]|nr:GMC family oxidoreductase N-terminal domain-containing protein [Gammaproteobacteria bacterium]
MEKLSEPIEKLIGRASRGDVIAKADYVIVGSGYGGAIAALRLAHPDREVLVFERGQAYEPGDFPYDESDLPGHVRIVGNGDGQGYADALFNMHVGEQTDVLVGSGLGGTSLINAGVVETPESRVFAKSAWPWAFRSDPTLLDDAYAAVRSLLQPRSHPFAAQLPKYRALTRLVEWLGLRSARTSVRPASIAVSIADGPNGTGVRQNKCTDCGNCVTGCNVGAKGSLDANIWPLARSRGASIYTNATIDHLEAARPSESSEYRYRLVISPSKQTSGNAPGETYAVLAKNVILAAGTLGSTGILMRSRDHLPLSDKLGERFSTNGDGLAMSFGQSEQVNAVASREQAEPEVENRVGPTITGYSQIVCDNPEGLYAHAGGSNDTRCASRHFSGSACDPGAASAAEREATARVSPSPR